MRTDKAPFNDIKVREALQLAVDLKTIAKTHYGGEMSGNPEGLISSKYTGWTLPYDQWSQDLKDEYTFNPTKAKELLAEAGYGDGFKTDIIAAGGGLEDIELLEIIKSEFQDIGVTMDIQLFADAGAKMDYAQAGKMDAMTYTNTVGHPRAPFQSIQLRTSTNVENYTYNKDSKYDTMAQQALTAPTIQEAQQLVTDCDMYALKQHWAVNIFGGVDHLCLQPWIKGYSGETMGGASYFYYSRFWISK